ncbi:MAG: PAS domain S-box protein [Bryobacteraceae bacterium]
MKEKLLVLDDEPLIFTSLEHLFEDDYEVFTTTDAEVALALALANDLAVILCDERMPGVSGHEFLRRVRQVSRATRVMISGYADLDVLTEAVNSGQIFAYISKPWDPLQLRAQVDAAVVHFKLVQQIDQERELLRALMENSPDLIYFKDRQSRFTRVNQAAARVFGASGTAECIGKSDADYFASQDALRWRLQEEEIVNSGQPGADLIEQLEDPQGRLRWMSTTKVPMFDRSSQVSGIAGISRDITALKNGEELLREQSERNRLIIETANDAFIGMDPDGTVTAWNPRAEQIFGWKASEVMGRSWCDVMIAPVYRAAHVRGVEHFLAAQGIPLNQAIELVALHRDGHEFPAEATVWPVRVAGACSFNAFVRDISERRRAEEARKKETTLVQLLQSVTVAANRSSTIEYAAQACLSLICSYTGWPVGHVYLRENNAAEELLPVGIWHLDDAARFAAFRENSDAWRFLPGAGLTARILVSAKPEWMVDLADNELSPRARVAEQAGLRSGFGFPIVAEEKVVGVLEFFSLETVQPDEEFLTMLGHLGSQLGQVIIRQRAEEDLKRAKASAESANRAKSEFLTTMSHEMRTPMNAILGMADLLSESSLGEEQRDYLGVFQKAGANLLDLINNILDLSKVESGHVELESIAFDLGALLQKIIEMLGAPARDRGLQFTLEIRPGVPLGLVGDPNRLRQILLNLAGNALKFTERGCVTLRVEPEPDLSGGDLIGPGSTSRENAVSWLRFSVVDTGIGIAADKVEMIFGRFTQADASTTRKYGGTGLGLAISKGLVELMGGRIGCSSEEGKGSTFFLTAPFSIQKEMKVPEPGRAAAIGAPPAVHAGPLPVFRILIVEDSEDNVVLLKAYLKGCGFELEFAENGKIGVESVISKHPHLVLMDLQMPVMGGLEATRAIRQWEAETHAPPIPILALTAHAAADAARRSREAGCNEHLTKPIQKSTLLEAISRHLDGKIRITPPQGIEGLVPKYLENVRRGIHEILAAGDAKDCDRARRLGHQFKGSGEGYGFPEIARTGAAVELAAKAADQDEIRSQILALSTYLDRVEIVV